MAKKITITELAKRLSVSVCTVNKALSGKAKISKATRERVIAEARRLGYRPNRMAQSLARNPIRLAYLHPANYASFFAPFEAGVRRAAERLADHHVTVSVHAIDVKKWQKNLLARLQSLLSEKDENISGLILSPSADPDYEPVCSLLAEHHVPLVQLGLEAVNLPAALTVRQDTVLSGRIAAELLSNFAGPAAIMVGDYKTMDHADKLRGFQEEADRRGLKIIVAPEHHDDPKLGYAVAKQLLREHPNLGGIYVPTDNFSGIAKALREHRQSSAGSKKNAAGRISAGGRVIKVVATGVFSEIQAAMDEGLVQFALDQRMAEQGELAVRLLHDLLSQNPLPSNKILLPPRIAVRGNIDNLS
jgi:LacI family transcriptional regulator